MPRHKEPESNYPPAFSDELLKEYLGGFALAYQQDLMKLWVGNGRRIFIRKTYRNLTMPHYTWETNPVFDYDFDGDNDGDEQRVNEIDFAPTDNSIAIVSPYGGRKNDLLISFNATSATPDWDPLPLPAFPLVTPGGTGDFIKIDCTTFFITDDIFYTVFKVGVFTDADPDIAIYTSTYIGIYNILGTEPVLTKSHQLINILYGNVEAPRGYFGDLLVFPDDINTFFVGENQDGLYRGIIPVTGTGDIDMICVSSYNPGITNTKTHTDVRSMDIFYNGVSKIIYIATDGGISKCDNISALASIDDANENVWENINGYGFTMTEFVGFSNSEQDKYRIIAAAPDGNTFIYKYDGTGNYRFHNLPRGDAYNASLSKTNIDKAIHNSNGGGPDIATEFNRVDLNAISWNSPGPTEIPRADHDPECTLAECVNGTCPDVNECLEYNIVYRPEKS